MDKIPQDIQNLFASMLNRIASCIRARGVQQGAGIFLNDNAPKIQRDLSNHGFDEHEDEVELLPWPAHPPELNIIESLWFILERLIRNR
ncbi:hypothetical protein TNCV_1026211 [Trichonephila clavipes]|nr:hypothetical protein TNCV_1026211 [Trichonephila clavipes]